MGGGGGSPATQQTTTKSELPDQVKPFITPYLNQANALAFRGYQPYQGNRLAGFNQDQNQGFEFTRTAANNGMQDLQTSRDALSKTASGALIGKNPYIDQLVNNAQGDITRNFNNSVANNTDAAFARQGAFGGSSWAQAQAENSRQLANQLSRTSTDIRGADYQQERQNQLNAARVLPELSTSGFRNAQALLGAGGAIQDENQAGLDNAYQQYLESRDYPIQNLGILGDAIGRTMGAGGSQTVTAPNLSRTNRTGSALGGALGGAMLGGMTNAAGKATFGPYGQAIGAGLGLLGGLF